MSVPVSSAQTPTETEAVKIAAFGFDKPELVRFTTRVDFEAESVEDFLNALERVISAGEWALRPERIPTIMINTMKTRQVKVRSGMESEKQ